jgi:hypothetical protein
MTRSGHFARRSAATSRKYLGLIGALLGLLLLINPAMAGQGGETKSAGGLTVYLGVVPAELVKGPREHSAQRPMHGGQPRGSHEHHIVAAVFESASNARIEDAAVTAKVSGLGLSGPQKILEPMKITDTISYGGYFNLTPDLYTIRVTIQRPGGKPVVLDFKYDHRRP